jgi:hypothetical protein
MKYRLLWMTIALIAAVSVATSAGVLLNKAPGDKAAPTLAAVATPTQAKPAIRNPAPKVRKVKMTITAYCPCPICCDGYARLPLWLRRLAGGDRLAPLLRNRTGFVAGPPNLRFGTEVSIPGYHDGQYVRVLDRGRAVVGNHLDVFMPNHRQALEWGVRTVTVTVREQR